MTFALLLSAAAWACSLEPDEPFVVEPDPDDTEAPLTPELVGLDIQRGHGVEHAGCGMATTDSCADIGQITLTFAQPEGDTHTADTIGYQIRNVSGALPDGLEVPDGLWTGPTLHLSWIDGATDDQEPIHFSMEVTAVDRAGNESDLTVLNIADGELTDPYDGPFTCSQAAHPASAWPLLLLAWGLHRRRRPH